MNVSTASALCAILFHSAALVATTDAAQAPAKSESPVFSQEELDQLLAPIALHPDALISQILMASTYPLEVVEAERWVSKNKGLSGGSLAAALEKQDWDPSVRSLVNFPQVLSMMSEQLDMMQKLGDAFIAQPKQVMDTIQKLRAKAKSAGYLDSTNEQKVIVKQEEQTQVIVIESANPQVIYVPTYNPTVVYGSWWYPAYPPHVYYPPGYVAGVSAISFGVGVACGAAWGYAWGGCRWGHGDIDIDVNRNVFANNSINRNSFNRNIQNTNINNIQNSNINAGNRNIQNNNVRNQANTWQHDPTHRKGAGYRDAATAQKFGSDRTAQTAQARDAYRGRAEAGQRDLASGSPGSARNNPSANNRSQPSQPNRADSAPKRQQPSNQGSALGGVDRGGREARSQSNRGRSSQGGGGGRSGGMGGRGGGGGGRRR